MSDYDSQGSANKVFFCRPRFDLAVKSSTVFGGLSCVLNGGMCLLGRVVLSLVHLEIQKVPTGKRVKTLLHE